MKTTIESWYDVCHSWHAQEAPEGTTTHPIHACLIEGQRYFVHAPSLPSQDPEYFNRLQIFAAQHDFQLKADRRKIGERAETCRRKKLLPIIFLTLGVSMEPCLAKKAVNTPSFPHEREISIKIDQGDLVQNPNKRDDTAESLNIENILRNHFVSGNGDPPTLMQDIKNLSRYYSRHPEAVKLINSLALSEWQLKYAPHTFQTDVSGTRLSVDRITIYFDPRSGAELKFYDKCADKKPYCIASPADALLHEFLHAHSIINDINRFIADGGMGNHIYPAEHERQTILKENVLYKAMSRRDNKPRPIRSEHSGRHVLVSCVTCLN